MQQFLKHLFVVVHSVWLRMFEMFSAEETNTGEVVSPPYPVYVARKIQVERWDATLYASGDADVRVDSLTGRCLETKEERLSVWMCKNDKEDVAQVALALATNFTLKKDEGMYIVLLRKDILEEEGFTFDSSEGNSKVADLNSRHFDIADLDVSKLLRIATEITRNVRQDKRLFPFTKKEVAELLQKAIEDNRVDLKDVKKENLKF